MSTTIEPGVPGAGAAAPGDVTSEVKPRELLPTPREVSRGATSADYEFVRPVEEEAPRKSGGDHVRAFFERSDPRSIEGVKTPIIVFGLIAFVGSWDDSAVGVIYPELRSEFTFNTTFLIAFNQAITIVVILTGPFIGYLVDRVNRVRLVRAGAVIVNVASLMLGTAGSFGAFMLSRGVLVFGNVLSNPARGPLMADYYPMRSRLRAFSFLIAAGVLGGALGPLIAGIVAARATWRSTVIAFAVIALIASFGTFFLREPRRGYGDMIEAGATKEEANNAVQVKPPTFWEAFRIGWGIRTLRRLWITQLFSGAGAAASIFIYLYFAEAGFGPEQRGRLQAGTAFLAFLFMPFAGAVGDKLLRVNPGRIMVLYGAVYIVQAIAMFGIAISPSPWLSILFLMFSTSSAAFLLPATIAVYSLIIPANMRGIGMQADAPFTLAAAVLTLPMLKLLSSLLGDLAASPSRAMLVAGAVPSVVAGFLVASAASTMGRDIRSARSIAVATDEAEKARQRGRSKMLICRDVDVTYDGVQVLFNVDFDVEEGELVALLGTNGAGKSTLMRAICGLQRAANGAIFLDGKDITQEPAHLNAARGIVMVPGGHAIFPTLTVEENLRTAAFINQDDVEYVAERTEEVLELFPILRERLNDQAGNMSGGEQQMLAVGQAFLMKPRLLMIDELSLGLAPAIVETLLATLRRIHANGTTIVLIEQSINVAMTIAERAVFMEKGEIRFDGPTSELMRRPELIRAVFMGGAATGGPLARTAAHRARGEAREQLLAVEDVSVSFGGVHALNGATLHVAAEEIVGIIGPNGAGKTTLFDIISGFLAPDSGAVLLSGVDATSLAPDARAKLGLGRSFQSARLFPSLTVRENIAVAMERVVKVKNPLLTATWSPRVRQNERTISRRVDGLVDIMGLGAYADKFVNELSTGTRRSVDIACIMASAPKMLLLDEPSSGLAQAETESLGPVLERVARDAGCGMLVIEHDIGLVSSISHRLYAMELGAVVASGPPDEVVRDPRVVSSYLAATEDVLVRSDLNRLMLEPEAGLGTTTEEKSDGHVR